jgi:hypothetical protein
MGLNFRISQLAGLADIVDGIVGGLGDKITFLVDGYLSYFATFIYTIFLAWTTLLDVIQLLFRKLAGLDFYVVNGQQTTQQRDFALVLINNQAIMNVFWSLAILAIVLLLVSTFIAVIKSEYQPLATRGGNSKSKVIGKSLKSIVLFATVPAVAILGLFVGNALLGSLDQATASDNIGLSGRIFAAASYEANRAREGYAPYDEQYVDSLEDVNHFGVFNDESNLGNFVVTSVADKIDYAFQTNMQVPDNVGYPTDFTVLQDPVISFVFDNIGEPNYPNSFSIYNYRLVWFYYDLMNFNFFIAIGVAIMLVTVLLMVLIGLIKRIFALTMLFVVSPPIIAITPINEEPFKNWKKEFIKSALSVYAIIVTMNLYIMIIPVLGQIQFFTSADTIPAFQGIGTVPNAGVAPLNMLAQLLLLAGGAVFFKDFSKTLAGMIGAEDSYGVGLDNAKKFKDTAAKGASLSAGIAGAGLKAANFPGKLAGKGIGNGAKAIKQGYNQGGVKGALKSVPKGAWNNISSIPKKSFNAAKNFAFPKDADGNRKGFINDKVDKVKKSIAGNSVFSDLKAKPGDNNFKLQGGNIRKQKREQKAKNKAAQQNSEANSNSKAQKSSTYSNDKVDEGLDRYTTNSTKTDSAKSKKIGNEIKEIKQDLKTAKRNADKKNLRNKIKAKKQEKAEYDKKVAETENRVKDVNKLIENSEVSLEEMAAKKTGKEKEEFEKKLPKHKRELEELEDQAKKIMKSLDTHFGDDKK